MEVSQLLCEENWGSLDREEEEILVDDSDDDEYIRILLDKEARNGGPQAEELLQNSRIHSARLEGIDYILRKVKVLGFGNQTAYASVTYLDRFLARRFIDVEQSWANKFLSMACLSLAAKMEEISVPLLSEFCEGYFFEGKVIQRMELLVLNALEWEMGSVSPFSFITFIANKICDNDLPDNLFSRTVELILSSIRDAKIMCEGPSVMAAAATLFVLDQNFTNDALQLKISCLTTSHSFKMERIISCYYSIQKMQIERLNRIESPGMSPSQLQTYGIASANSGKRKRLVFEIGECSNQAEDKPKP